MWLHDLACGSAHPLVPSLPRPYRHDLPVVPIFGGCREMSDVPPDPILSPAAPPFETSRCSGDAPQPARRTTLRFPPFKTVTVPRRNTAG
jgi:hypothetical protein